MNGTNYYVVGEDGEKYGPADFDLLVTWLDQGRIGPTTNLRNGNNGNSFKANTLPGLFQAKQSAISPNAGYVPTPPVVTPHNHLVESILIALCCCPLIGFVAIVYSVMSNSSNSAGRYREALMQSHQAGKWVKAGVIFGVVFYGLLALYGLIMNI